MSQELINAGAGQDEVLVRVCSWCRRMQHGEAWVDLRDEAVQPRIFAHPTPPQVTHGICDECARRMLDSVTRK